jgi:hypothetical protein
MHKNSALIFALLLFTFPFQLPGQESENDDLASTMKAVFIYNFTKYIEWPDSDTTGCFKIGVIGNSSIITPLKNIEKEKRVNKIKIKIITINDPREIKDCRILLIDKSEKHRLADILSEISGKNILTIGDTPDFAASGMAINFIVINEKIKFEINSDALNRAGLKASSHLLKLAILVEEKKTKQ